jgi:hypothetical protein
MTNEDKIILCMSIGSFLVLLTIALLSHFNII